MSRFLDIVQEWYGQNESEINHDNNLFYLVDLFQELTEEGLDKKDLPEIGQRLLFLLDQDFPDQSLHMLYQRCLAEEINYAYQIASKNIDEVKDEPVEIQQVVPVEDGDIYPNDTDEPDIDLRGVDLGDVTYDEEFLRELGIDNE